MPVLYRAGEQIDEYNNLRLLRQGRMAHSYLAVIGAAYKKWYSSFHTRQLLEMFPLLKELYFTTTCP